MAYTLEQPELFRTRRRRRCDNGHTFTTYEVHDSVVRAVGQAKLDAKVRWWAANTALFNRDRAIWQERKVRKTKYSALAAEYGLSESGVRRVVATMEKFLNAD